MTMKVKRLFCRQKATYVKVKEDNVLGEKQKLTGKIFILIFFKVIIIINLTIIFLNLRAYAGFAVNEIIKLEKENQRLNEEIADRLNFKFRKQKKFEFYGENYKYLFNEKKTDDLWLFKIYESSFPVNATVVTYRLAQLLGIDMPEITGTTLLINEREKYGSIQKMFPDVKNIDEVRFSSLSVKQIESIMKNQVLDWIVSNVDIDESEFLIGKYGRIIAIDKDETFSDEGKAISLADNVGGDSYYYQFWKAFLEGKVETGKVDFKKVFEVIDYFQKINDEYIINIFNDLLRKVTAPSEFNSIVKNAILKKHNLRKDFEDFYKDLAKNKIFSFRTPVIDKNNTYAQYVLDKLKENIYQKRYTLSRLKPKKTNKKENIKIIYCLESLYLVNELNYVYKENFFSSSNRVIKKLNDLKKKNPPIYEQFAIDLYIEQVKNLQNRKNIENFMLQGIKEIILCSEEMTDSEILKMEYNLRVIYGKEQKEFGYYRKEIERKPRDILAHLDYIKYPVKGDLNREEKLILKEYKEWLNKYPVDFTYQVLYGIVSNDEEYLKRIEDDFAWKHLGLALIYSFDKEGEKAIKECNKALLCKKERGSSFCSYMLLGVLHEYNSKWERFGEGFDMEKSIRAYKKALKINPESVKAHLNMGVLYLMSEKPDKALEEFKEVNRLDFQYGKKHFNLDKINKKSSYRNKKEYLEAIRMNTLSGRHHYILGLAYLIKEDKNLAQRHFNKAKEFGYKANNKVKKK